MAVEVDSCRDGNIGALTIRIRLPLKGSFKGVYTGSVAGFYNIRTLIIRIGFWGTIHYNHNKAP